MEKCFLDAHFRRLLCNALIHPHFDYAFDIASNPNLTKKLKDKLQATRNKRIRSCLKIKCRKHILNKHLERLNYLPINQRFR